MMLEPIFTDQEHRLLLAALGREKEICKRLDREYLAKYPDDKDVKLLTPVIESIEAKVYRLQHPYPELRHKDNIDIVTELPTAEELAGESWWADQGDEE